MHVQCTCKCFAPIAVLALLQVKRWEPVMPNLQDTCILPHVCAFEDIVLWGSGCARHRTGS